MSLMHSLQTAIWSQLPTRFFETVKAGLTKNTSNEEIRIANYLSNVSFIPISYNLDTLQLVHGRAVIWCNAFTEDYYDICYGYLYSVIKDEQYRMWFRNHSIRFGSTMFKYGMEVAKGETLPNNRIKTWRNVNNTTYDVLITGLTESAITITGASSVAAKLDAAARMTNFQALYNFVSHSKELEGLMPTFNAIVSDHKHIATVAKQQSTSNGSIRFTSKQLFKEAFVKGESINQSLLNEEQRGFLNYHGMLDHYVVPIWLGNHKAKISTAVIARNVDQEDFFNLCSGYYMGYMLSKGNFAEKSGFYNAITEYLPCERDSIMFKHGIEVFRKKVPPLNLLTVSVVGKDVCINVEEESVILVPITDEYDHTRWVNARNGIISTISYDAVDYIRNNSMGINRTYSRLNAIITDKMIQLLKTLGIDRPPKNTLNYETLPSGQELIEMHGKDRVTASLDFLKGTAGMLPIDMTADVFYHPEDKTDTEPTTGLEWV